MPATPTEIIRDFYGKLATGDAPGALGLMAPDIQWTTMWHYKVKGRSPSAVAEGLFKPLMAEWTSFSLVPTEFVTEGGTVVSLGDFKGVHGATGKTCEARYAHVWTVSDGRIATFRQYSGRGEARGASRAGRRARRGDGTACGQVASPAASRIGTGGGRACDCRRRSPGQHVRAHRRAMG